MHVLLIVLLFVNAAYNVIVWPRFFSRIAKDPRARDESGARTTFFRVHAILIGTALLIALVSLVAAIVAIFVGG